MDEKKKKRHHNVMYLSSFICVTTWARHHWKPSTGSWEITKLHTALMECVTLFCNQCHGMDTSLNNWKSNWSMQINVLIISDKWHVTNQTTANLFSCFATYIRVLVENLSLLDSLKHREETAPDRILAAILKMIVSTQWCTPLFVWIQHG